MAEAFTRAWASWRVVRGHPAPRAWVVRTALNLNVSWWRRRKREVALGDSDLGDSALGVPGGDDRRLPDDELLIAVRRLPVRQQQVIILRVFFGLDTQATGQAIGIAPGTVGVHLHRALATLRAQMQCPRLSGGREMNDDELLAAVRDCLTTARDQVAGEQLERPVLAIISRARRRRLRQSLTTTATAAIVAVAAFALLLPGSSGRSHHTTSVRLAAWTVIDEPGGKIGVTIRELNDPAGLQRRLRADGVPVTDSVPAGFRQTCRRPQPPPVSLPSGW